MDASNHGAALNRHGFIETARAELDMVTAWVLPCVPPATLATVTAQLWQIGHCSIEIVLLTVSQQQGGRRGMPGHTLVVLIVTVD
jgi:hypothetical protein